jgi:SAM-dependent methyltransferase
VTPEHSAFSEAARYYVAGRPPYSRALLLALQRELALDGHGRLLDVGCGPGFLTVEMASAFDESVALDPEPSMLAAGRLRAEAAGRTGIRWVRGRAEDLPDLGIGPCRLVTFGQSYHWTAGVPVLDAVHHLLAPRGAIALIGHRAEGRHQPEGPDLPRIPEDEILALVQHFADHDAGPPPKDPGKRATPHLHEADLEASLFGRCRTVYAPGRPDIVRDIDSVVAGYFSTSYAAPRRFGHSREPFETAVRELLRQRSPQGLFWDWPGDTEIVLATK